MGGVGCHLVKLWETFGRATLRPASQQSSTETSRAALRPAAQQSSIQTSRAAPTCIENRPKLASWKRYGRSARLARTTKVGYMRMHVCVFIAWAFFSPAELATRVLGGVAFVRASVCALHACRPGRQDGNRPMQHSMRTYLGLFVGCISTCCMAMSWQCLCVYTYMCTFGHLGSLAQCAQWAQHHGINKEIQTLFFHKRFQQIQKTSHVCHSKIQFTL